MNPRRFPHLRWPALCLGLLILAVAAPSAAAQQAKVLTLDDYPQWKRITSVALSADGNWMSYAYSPNDGADTLYVEWLQGEKRHVIPRGSGVSFSEDSRWIAFMVSQPQEQVEQARQARRPVTRQARAMELATGRTVTEESASSFRFSEQGRWLAVLKDRADPQARHQGRDLILHDLAEGRIYNIGNVSQFAFNKGGTLLAYLVDAATPAGNGLYLMEPASGRVRPLESGQGDYANLTWNEEGTAIALLKGETPQGKAQRENDMLIWTDLGGRREQAIVYRPSEDDTFPADLVISQLGSLSWSKDGARLQLGLKEQEEAAPREQEARPDVDVWHWKDEDVQSVQMVRAGAARRFTYAAVFHLGEGRLIRLADEQMRAVTFTDNPRWALGRDDSPYGGEITWGGSRSDWYRVDLTSGDRQLLEAELRRTMGTSPDGRWFLYVKNEQVMAREVARDRVVNLSEIAGVDFIDRDNDYPYELPARGVAGWSRDGRTVLLNHTFDIWSVPLTGGRAVNLTGGVGDREQIRFRLVRLDREQETIDLGQPLLLSAYGEWTKKSGYWTMRSGREPSPLIWEDRMIGSVRKADKADRLIFTMQTFEDFPDWYLSGLDFARPRRMTEANPQQAEYAWGRRVLVDYQNSRGVRLQATLALPADYQPGRRYPMIVYFYDRMSQRHHQYSMPVYDDRPHMSTYASNGYLVLMPDVIYETGRPGTSSLDCITAAVEKVIELGYADRDRIGLQGHSWGGYQSSFIVTQTDLFAAVVTGAPPTNLVSFYNTLYRSSGTVQQGITEVGQVRMGTTPFEDFDLFVSQSPVHHVPSITTPFMILHGTEDGAVDWMQGLEFYNMARRQGKEVILLSYPGEAHHLNRRENQKDFQIRMMQYFDHYLKGVPAPRWISEGVPHLQKDRASPFDGLPPN